VLVAGFSFGDEIYVPNDYTTIQEAIDASQDGDEILIHPGVYYESLTVYNKSISITGIGGYELTTVDAYGLEDRCLDIQGKPERTVWLRGITFQNGVDVNTDVFVNSYGGGIFVQGVRLIMDQCRVMKCEAVSSTDCNTPQYAEGGGIYITRQENAGTNLEPSIISRSIITGNRVSSRFSQGAGLFIYDEAGCLLDSCIISGNTSSGACTGGWGVAAGAKIYGEGSSLHSCLFAEGQDISIPESGVHGNYNVFCGEVDGPLAGIGNQYDCTFYGTTAACCIDGQCEDLALIDCVQVMGHFSGIATNCAETECVSTDDPFGACCVSGMCGEMSDTDCKAIGGDWGGDYVQCSQVKCEPPPMESACCLGGMCVTLLETDCTSVGGIWQGDKADCATAKCEPWTGACCVSGECLEVTLDECFSASGSYSGDLTLCQDTDCTSQCYGDLTGDGVVNITDVLAVISAWGVCP
jgi:hypothetical protein